MKYVSDNGILTFGGGDAKFGVTAIEGFGLPEPNVTTVEYAGYDGQEIVSKKDTARTMTISGVLNGSQADRLKAYKTLHSNGSLYCKFGKLRRKINCRCSQFEDFFRKSNELSEFAIQFTADYPYFNDFYDTVIPLYGRENNLTDGITVTTFTLPCIFTRRINKGSAVNNGDKIVYPKITVQTDGAGSGTAYGLTITNETTNKVITLNHDTVSGEKIVFDLSKRTINSSISGAVTNKISDDTVLSDCFLKLGKNVISFSNSKSGQTTTASITFNPEYLTAVI